MENLLGKERSWLDSMVTSKLLGICFLDEDGRLVHRLEGDEELRELIIGHYFKRVKELETLYPEIEHKRFSSIINRQKIKNSKS